jgi:hypothetical protein
MRDRVLDREHDDQLSVARGLCGPLGRLPAISTFTRAYDPLWRSAQW